VDVRQEDVQETSWTALANGRGGHVITDAPYYLSSPILFVLLEQRQHLAEAILTMQPRTKAHGILSVLLRLFLPPKEAFKLLFTTGRVLQNREVAGDGRLPLWGTLEKLSGLDGGEVETSQRLSSRDAGGRVGTVLSGGDTSAESQDV
jgi:hypothetical protein